MVDHAARTSGTTSTGPRVVAHAPAEPHGGVTRPARGVTALLLVVATVATVVASASEGVGTTVVRVAFVALWLSLPWLATVGVTHLAARSGAPGAVVSLSSTLVWVGACGLWGALTPVLLGGEVDLGWALAGGAAGAALLVLSTAASGRGAPAPPK